MAAPPVPAAGTAPPPLNKLPFTIPSTGMLTLMAISFLTQLWAAVLGEGGLAPSIDALTAQVAFLTAQVGTLAGQVSTLIAQVATIFGMHGDGTLAGDGTLTVTKTNGIAFGFFATGTNAANLTGTLSPARIADNTLPYAKLVNAAVPMLLGASAAGPLVAITIGAGIVIVGGALVDDATIVTTVAGLPPQPYPQGRRRFVSDALGPVFGAAVVGAGAVPVPVYSDGAAWNVG